MAGVRIERPLPGRAVRGRLWAYGVSLALAAAVIWPVLGDPRDDSFPLSTYPMFSGRQSPETDISHIVAFTAEGERSVLPPEAVANDEVVQAFETIRQAVAQGPAATRALCEDAAAWAAGHREGVARVVVVTDTYDAVAYFDGDKAPRGSTVHAECEVPR
jgi:hypothetical protein